MVKLLFDKYADLSHSVAGEYPRLFADLQLVTIMVITRRS